MLGSKLLWLGHGIAFAVIIYLMLEATRKRVPVCESPEDTGGEEWTGRKGQLIRQATIDMLLIIAVLLSIAGSYWLSYEMRRPVVRSLVLDMLLPITGIVLAALMSPAPRKPETSKSYNAEVLGVETYPGFTTRWDFALLAVAVLSIAFLVFVFGFVWYDDLTTMGDFLLIQSTYVLAAVAVLILVSAAFISLLNPDFLELGFLERKLRLAKAEVREGQDALVYRAPFHANVILAEDIRRAVIHTEPLRIDIWVPRGRMLFDHTFSNFEEIAEFVLKSSSEVGLAGTPEQIPDFIKRLLTRE